MALSVIVPIYMLNYITLFFCILSQDALDIGLSQLHRLFAQYMDIMNDIDILANHAVCFVTSSALYVRGGGRAQEASPQLHTNETMCLISAICSHLQS